MLISSSLSAHDSSLRELIAVLQGRTALNPAQVKEAVTSLVSEEIDQALKAQFLESLRDKGESASEMAAFVDALLGFASDPEIDPARLSGPILDVCGTGGDQMELFNISTSSMFVLAAGGVCVVKHGNRAITSQCGGADVLETLGVQIDLSPAALRHCVVSLGLGFVFAPRFHPAFKAIAPVRKALAARGIPTIFNMLGPLLNPVRPPFQMVGIFSAARLGIYAETLASLGRKRAWALHGNGTDELTTTGPSDVFEVGSGAPTRQFSIVPEELGLRPASLEQLRGGNREQNARHLLEILDGSERGPKTEIVLLNAAAGFVVAGLMPSLAAGLDHARKQIESGKALAKLHALQSFRAS